MNKPVVLIILDGWGISSPGPGNAITLAKKPNFDKFWSVYPHTQLLASGEAVGLPKGENGNSETGHINLGAGQIVFQDLPRIDMSVADGSFFSIKALNEAIEHVQKNESNLHLIGLIGAGGVHSSIGHLLALIRLAKERNISRLFLHLFTDGRDSPPTAAQNYLKQTTKLLEKTGLGKIATLCGRYYALDRDNRWERTKKAYDLLTLGRGKAARSPFEAINDSYNSGKTDEFIEPILLDKEGLINDHDAVIFFNFRIDRPRQLTKAFVLPDFEQLKIKKASFDPYAERYGYHIYEVPGSPSTFKREKILNDLFFVTMTEYERGLPVSVAFPPEPVKIPLARIFSENNLRQFHLSESEKFPHVTTFFDGGRNNPFPGEDWLEIPSPKVATYDQKPEMSAKSLTDTLEKKLTDNIYDFIIVNYANADMLGHTGVIPATVKACEFVDSCLGKIVNHVLNLGGCCLITADHGNAEEMINPATGEIDTEHSNNPVPLIIVDRQLMAINKSIPVGILADVAPTILGIMDIQKPETITGKNLLNHERRL